MFDAGCRITRIDSAALVVVENRRRSGKAGTGSIADFVTVAEIVVGAARSCRDRCMHRPNRWIA
jgi:hypothetical protein